MLSKSCGYAIRGILYLALKHSERRKIGIQELVAELRVPPHFMGKIMQDLVRRDIISSIKGPNGGFSLNDNTLNTPMMTIVEAIDGPALFRRCVLNLPDCSGKNPCPLHHEVTGFRDYLAHTLRMRTVQDLVTSVERGHTMLRPGSVEAFLTKPGDDGGGGPEK